MNYVDVSKKNTMDMLAGALRVTRAWRDDILVVDARHGVSVDEASARLWADVMHPAAGDTWIVSLIPTPGAHRDLVAAALAYRARHFAKSLTRELEAA